MKKLYVQNIIDYVEEHIEESFSLDDIANHIGYTKFYLHKLFYIYTGMYLMDYVRKRKLEYSLQDLKTADSIMTIAVKYAFSSDRTYSRAFKKVYGVAPGKYRNNTSQLSPKMLLYQIGGIKMLPYLSESKPVNINKMYALTYAAVSKEPEMQSIDYLTEYRINNKIQVFTEIGFDIPVTEEESQQGLRGYEYWIIVSEEIYKNHVDDVVIKKEVPKGKYLTLTIDDPFIDPFERIPNGWKKLSSDVEANYTFRDGMGIYGFEEKIDTLGSTSMKLYMIIE